MPGQVVVVFVAASAHNLVAAEMTVLLLLRWQVSFTLDCVEVASSLSQLIVAVPISNASSIIPEVLQEHPPSALVQYLVLFATHHQVPLLLVDGRVLRIIGSHAHITVGSRAPRNHLVVHA